MIVVGAFFLSIVSYAFFRDADKTCRGVTSRVCGM